MHQQDLRQGDPLSPMLFILEVDVLQRMIGVNTGITQKLTPRLNDPIIALQYADDMVIVATTKGNTLRVLKLALHAFCKASSLNINFSKSSIVPFNILPLEAQTASQLMQCPLANLPIINLGLPLTITKSGTEFYVPIIEKLEKWLAG
jgi:Reverse transcriptase (RNA-dependent DNA polymerase)